MFIFGAIFFKKTGSYLSFLLTINVVNEFTEIVCIYGKALKL